MNDSLIIAGYVVLTLALMAGSYRLGRGDRKAYTPGPAADPGELAAQEMIAHMQQLKQRPREGANERLVDSLIEAGIPVPAEFAYWKPEESVRLVPRYPKPTTLPPPGTNYHLVPEEREFWLNLYGDPTKKEQS